MWALMALGFVIDSSAKARHELYAQPGGLYVTVSKHVLGCHRSLAILSIKGNLYWLPFE